jgi:hypothetical protein
MKCCGTQSPYRHNDSPTGSETPAANTVGQKAAKWTTVDNVCAQIYEVTLKNMGSKTA